MRTSIFDKLYKKNIVHSVGVSPIRMTGCKRESNTKECIIYTIAKYYRSLRHYGFVLCHTTDDKTEYNYSNKRKDYYHLIEKTMTPLDMEYFKFHIDKYKKVLHCKEGRMYELKHKSLKDLYYL